MVNRLHPFLLSAVALFIATGTASADTISLRADTWCPFNCDPTSDKPGYLIEIAKAVFEPAGHKVDYQPLNWARAIVETRTGKYAGIIGAAKTDAPDFIFPENALGNSASCFYAKTDSTWAYTGDASLSAVVLGVTKDYSYGEPVDLYLKANPGKVQVAAGDDTIQRNIKLTELGRVGAFVDDVNVASYFIKEHNITSLKQVGCLEKTPSYIAFSPANPNSKQYAKMLSDGVESLRQSGKLKLILDRYGISDWK